LCCEQLGLKNQEIDFLNSVINNNDKIVARLDSISRNNMAKASINEKKFLKAEEQIKYEKKRARKFRRQRNGIIVGGGLLALLFVFASVN